MKVPLKDVKTSTSKLELRNLSFMELFLPCLTLVLRIIKPCKNENPWGRLVRMENRSLRKKLSQQTVDQNSYWPRFFRAEFISNNVQLPIFIIRGLPDTP